MKKYFYLNYNSSGKIWLKKISIISSTIQYLSIENMSCSLQELIHLIKHTPNLRYLNTTIHYDFQDEQISVIDSSIISLKLTFESSVPVLIKLFKNKQKDRTKNRDKKYNNYKSDTIYLTFR